MCGVLRSPLNDWKNDTLQSAAVLQAHGRHSSAGLEAERHHRHKVQLEYDISPQQEVLLGSSCIIQPCSIIKLPIETRKNEEIFIRNSRQQACISA